MNIAKRFQLAAFLLICSAAVFAEQTGSFTKTLTVNGQPDAEIQTGSGNIVVHTGNGNTVVVNARITASDMWFSSGPSAQEKIKRIEQNPPVVQSGNLITIGRINESDLRSNVSISYDVTLPANSRLRTESGSGDVTVDGVNGPVKMNSGSGNATARNLGDELRVGTGSGDIHIDHVKGPVRVNAGSGTVDATGVGGAFYAETGSGDITLHQEASGTVMARTGSGNVRLHNLKGGLEAHTGSGDVEADGEARNDWNVQTGSGSIDLKLPAKAAFTVDARSSSGSIEVNHPITVQGVQKRNQLQGKVGEGGPLLHLQSGSGEIRVD